MNIKHGWILLVLAVSACSVKNQTPPMQTAILNESPMVCYTNNVNAQESYSLGYNASKNNQIKLAQKHYEQAIKLDPNFCDAMDNLARLYRLDGRFQEAINLYQRSLALNATNRVAIINLAVVYREIGELHKAVEQYEQIITLDTDDPEGYYGLGLSYFDLQKFDLAIENAELAARKYDAVNSPYIAHAQYILGLSYFKIGNCQASQKNHLVTYRQFKDDPTTNYHLGICYLTQALYDKDLALQYLTIAEQQGLGLPDEITTILDSEELLFVSLEKPNNQHDMFIRFSQLLEREPFHEQAKTMRAWMIKWLNDTPDVNVKVCMLFEPLASENYEYTSELMVQMIFGNASYQLLNKHKEYNELDIQFAGVLSVLAAYQSIISEQNNKQIEYLESLILKKERGSLRDFYEPIIDSKCKGD